MKTIAVLVPMLTLALIGFAGQTNQVDLHQTTPPQGALLPAPIRENDALPGAYRTNSVVRFYRDQKNYDGVLPELRRQKGEFFRATPQSSSRDFRNVSVNPRTGQAEGVILFSMKF
jgi:hypothetical protein